MFRPLVWLSRIRHRRGYGIHSPFAYNIVKGVIYERGSFLAYETLHNERRRRGIKKGERDDRLLLRLVNDHQPKNALCFTQYDDISLEYLKAGCRSCIFSVVTPHHANKKLEKQQYDLVYMTNVEQLNVVALLPLLSERALLILRHIRKDKVSLESWKQAIENPKIRVSFDLYKIGIAYTETRFNKENHIINYP